MVKVSCFTRKRGVGLVEVDPQSLSLTKRSYGLSSPLTCNGLFVIVRGSSIGKLARRLFGTQDHKWVLQIVRLEPAPEESKKRNSSTVPRFTEIVEEGESPIVVFESSIALVNQMPDEQKRGIQVMATRRQAAEIDWIEKGCPALALTDLPVDVDFWPN